MKEYYINITHQKLSINIYSNIKTFVIVTMLFIVYDLCGQSFVIGEPKGILDKVITHYMETKQIGDSVIIEVEVKQTGDTTIFCIGEFISASDIFLCLPSAIYKKGENYLFVKTGAERFFSFNEAYLKFIYSLTAKFTHLNIKIKSYFPFDMEFINEQTSTGSGDYYGWHWYYVVNYSVVKTINTNHSFYPYCQYGGE